MRDARPSPLAQEHGSSLGLSIAALMAELGKTQKEREEGERYRREPALASASLPVSARISITYMSAALLSLTSLMRHQ